MKLKPLGDRLIVKAIEEELTTASGLVLPDTVKEKPQKGEVVAAGDGRLDDDGKRVPLDVKKGDEVLYSKYGGTEIKIDGEDLLVLRESDIVGLLDVFDDGTTHISLDSEESGEAPHRKYGGADVGIEERLIVLEPDVAAGLDPQSGRPAVAPSDHTAERLDELRRGVKENIAHLRKLAR